MSKCRKCNPARYQGIDLECIHARKGDCYDDIFKNIDDIVCNIQDSGQGPIPSTTVQSDWKETDPTKESYIKNKDPINDGRLIFEGDSLIEVEGEFSANKEEDTTVTIKIKDKLDTYLDSRNFITNIAGHIVAGENITIEGNGTTEEPYIINSNTEFQLSAEEGLSLQNNELKVIRTEEGEGNIVVDVEQSSEGYNVVYGSIPGIDPQTLSIEGRTVHLSGGGGSVEIPVQDTVTRIKGENGTYVSGDIQIIGENGTEIIQDGNTIKIKSPDPLEPMEYTAGMGITLEDGQFSVNINTEGAGEIITDIVETESGLTLVRTGMPNISQTLDQTTSLGNESKLPIIVFEDESIKSTQFKNRFTVEDGEGYYTSYKKCSIEYICDSKALLDNTPTTIDLPYRFAGNTFLPLTVNGKVADASGNIQLQEITNLEHRVSHLESLIL